MNISISERNQWCTCHSLEFESGVTSLFAFKNLFVFQATRLYCLNIGMVDQKFLATTSLFLRSHIKRQKLRDVFVLSCKIPSTAGIAVIFVEPVYQWLPVGSCMNGKRILCCQLRIRTGSERRGKLIDYTHIYRSDGCTACLITVKKKQEGRSNFHLSLYYE